MKILYLILLSIVSGIFGRLGGSAKNGSWYDFLKHPKTRDVGCALVSLVALVLLGVEASIQVHLISLLLLMIALSTYGDDIFEYDNFYYHGMVCSVAWIPYALERSVSAWSFLLRTVLLIVFMGLWHEWQKKDVIEEFGRYCGLTLSVGILA